MAQRVSLLTDRYELTMLSALVEEGMGDRRAEFEAFTRRLPEGRRYGVMAGLGRLLPMLAEYHFTDSELSWLVEEKVVTPRTARMLEKYSFTGDIYAYPEGELYFPNSPVVRVSGKLGECLILETLILSVLNYDCAVASAASRMVSAADGRPLLEMGSRRVHEQAGVAAARAAYLAGFASTSNLEAGFTYQVPTMGTAAHAFTLAHATELEAFHAQVKAHGPGTTLLVDTYDTPQGIRNAVEAAGTGLGAVRLDSGDPAVESRKARALLDSLGAYSTRVVVTGDLDEYLITALSDAPVDVFGVGTRVSTGSGHPAAGMVYKLVSVEDDAGVMRPVQKRSTGKKSLPGVKSPWREYDETGILTGEWLNHQPSTECSVQVPVAISGQFVALPTLHESRDFHAEALRRLPGSAKSVASADAYLTAKEKS